MKPLGVTVILILSVLFFSCTTLLNTLFIPLKPPLLPESTFKNSSVENYKYIYISPTKSLTSSAGYVDGGASYGVYGATQSKSVNPSDVISGILIKKGFIRLPELKEELNDKTLIVNYGESGKRDTGLGGYTIEVTIQFVSGKSSELVSSCTAEGQGQTEADDIRQAITRCITALYP